MRLDPRPSRGRCPPPLSAHLLGVPDRDIRPFPRLVRRHRRRRRRRAQRPRPARTRRRVARRPSTPISRKPWSRRRREGANGALIDALIAARDADDALSEEELVAKLRSAPLRRSRNDDQPHRQRRPPVAGAPGTVRGVARRPDARTPGAVEENPALRGRRPRDLPCRRRGTSRCAAKPSPEASASSSCSAPPIATRSPSTTPRFCDIARRPGSPSRLRLRPRISASAPPLAPALEGEKLRSLAWSPASPPRHGARRSRRRRGRPISSCAASPASPSPSAAEPVDRSPFRPARRARGARHGRLASTRSGRRVAVDESLDAHDDLLAGVQASLERSPTPYAAARTTFSISIRRGSMGRFVLEYVEAGAGDAPLAQQPRHRRFVDHLAARRVDDVGVGLQQREPARLTADGRSPACAGNSPKRCPFAPASDRGFPTHVASRASSSGPRRAAAVVIVDGESEAARPAARTAAPMRPMPRIPRRLPQMRWPQHRCRPPAAPVAARAPGVRPRRGAAATARISAIVMSAVSSVSTPGVLVTVIPCSRAPRQIDVIDSGAVARDQFQAFAAGVDNPRVDAVAHRRHQHFRLARRRRQFVGGQRAIIRVSTGCRTTPSSGFRWLPAVGGSRRPRACNGSSAGAPAFGERRDSVAKPATRNKRGARPAPAAGLYRSPCTLSEPSPEAPCFAASFASFSQACSRRSTPPPNRAPVACRCRGSSASPADRANLRTGPGFRYPIAWVFLRRAMPVEVVGEFEQWRRIRDRDGAEGWIHKALLSGRRTVTVIGGERGLRSDPPRRFAAPRPAPKRGSRAAFSPAAATGANSAPAAVRGWMPRGHLWGVYAGETLRVNRPGRRSPSAPARRGYTTHGSGRPFGNPTPADRESIDPSPIESDPIRPPAETPPRRRAWRTRRPAAITRRPAPPAAFTETSWNTVASDAPMRASARCALGTMTWGQQNTEAEAHSPARPRLRPRASISSTLRKCIRCPPRAATAHRTEEIIGSWLARPGNRERAVVATKVAGRAVENPSGPPAFSWIRGGPRLDAAHIAAALDASLRRLRTDCIDLYQVHWPERR